MLYTCSKKYKFDYAHQLYTSFTTLCHETIHGHSGVVEIVFQRVDSKLNDDQMVIDFGEISAYVKKHIMEKYDHALFMPDKFDEEYLNTLKNGVHTLKVVYNDSEFAQTEFTVENNIENPNTGAGLITDLLLMLIGICALGYCVIRKQSKFPKHN
jgi:6-pyruvoyl-tetrahydropterin synthase